MLLDCIMVWGTSWRGPLPKFGYNYEIAVEQNSSSVRTCMSFYSIGHLATPMSCTGAVLLNYCWVCLAVNKRANNRRTGAHARKEKGRERERERERETERTTTNIMNK